jgi:WD40 repeat protein
MRFRRLLPVVVSFLIAGSPAPAQQTAEQLRAEIGFKKLQEHFADDKYDRDKLRGDILLFRRTHGGTVQAVQAAELLRQLPSPLDKLEAAKIKSLEIFDWQPKELVAILGEHRGRQGAAASCVAYSPDRKFIASGGAHLVRLWETEPKKLLRLIVNLSAPNVTCVAISPDNKRLAAGGVGAIYLYDLEGTKGTLKATIPAGSTTITSVAFDPKGRPLLACGSYDTKVRLFDLDKKDPKEMEISLLARHQQSVNSVAFSPDGAYLASGSTDGTVHLWKCDGAKTDEAAKLDANPKGVNAVAFSKDGRVLAAGCADGTVVLWNVAGSRATPRAAFPAHASAAVSVVAFSPGGHTLLTGGSDGLVRQWDMARKSPTRIGELKGHAAAVTGLAYAADGGSIASSSNDWTVRLWDPSARRERVPPEGPLSHVYSLAFSPDGSTLATGSYDRYVRLAAVSGDAPKERIAFKGSEVYQASALAYAPDGRTLATGEYGGVVHFWTVINPARPQSAGQIKDLPGYIYSLAYSPDGNRLLIQHYQTASLYDVRSRNRLHLFEADPKGTGIASIVLSPDGTRVAASSGNYLKKGNDYVKNKDGTFVYFDCYLRLWDADTGKLLHKEASALPQYGIAFTPEGRQLLSCAWEPLLRFWDRPGDSLKEVATTKTPAGYVYRITFSPDGRYFVTHDVGNHIIVWDAATRTKLRDWALGEYVGTEAFAPDSRHLAIGLATGVTYILRLDGTARSAAK